MNLKKEGKGKEGKGREGKGRDRGFTNMRPVLFNVDLMPFLLQEA